MKEPVEPSFGKGYLDGLGDSWAPSQFKAEVQKAIDEADQGNVIDETEVWRRLRQLRDES